jgi:hypothetical protein
MKHEKIDTLPTDTAYLHFDAVRIHEDKVQVDYELVLPLKEVDCRGTFDHRGRTSRPKSHRHVWLDTLNNRRLPLGRTSVGTTNESYPFSLFDGSIDLPFRDGAHCSFDNEKLKGLPVIYSIGGVHYLLTGER